MSAKSLVFNPQKHICKFGYKQFGHINNVLMNINGDIYNKELRFDFLDARTDKQIDTIGFLISDERMALLLPLLDIDKYEKYRDLPSDWDLKISNGCSGYRDGWSYLFWCTSENGLPLYQKNMSAIFTYVKMPPYEVLLEWIKSNYQYEDKIKNKSITW